MKRVQLWIVGMTCKKESIQMYGTFLGYLCDGNVFHSKLRYFQELQKRSIVISSEVVIYPFVII